MLSLSVADIKNVQKENKTLDNSLCHASGILSYAMTYWSLTKALHLCLFLDVAKEVSRNTEVPTVDISNILEQRERYSQV